MSNQQPGSNHRSLTGLVTKLVGDGATYGFINDEIFFPQTNVSGGPAAVGDQVFAECEFSAHLPIKWNATSVKILNKAGQFQANNSGHDIQQQNMMNQQQQFNQSGSVAVTYQQHRQQRQQMLGNNQQDTSTKQQPQQSSDLTTRLLDHTTGTGDFFGSANNKPFPQQQQQQQSESNIQPFQDQPMGPANFTYTSQLGSAFVQNQFVAPFINQPPPNMLPQQQHILPSNQMQPQNNNQHRQNQHNKGVGNRFNNNHDKNDRQNNRRNQNRNNDKFDRSRSGERDGGQGGRSSNSKNNDTRDRSAGRNNKRDDIPVRPSPPPQSSARSSTSISSDRGSKARRHYEPHNIPKIQIMTNMNAYNMKQRCPSSVHVPSDLKDIIVNRHFRLDIKNTPKPIKFIIEQENKEVPVTKQEVNSELKADATNESTGKETEEREAHNTQVHEVSEQKEIKENQDTSQEVKKEDKTGSKSIEHLTPPSSKSDIKLNHKYGVKVILMSLPDLEGIYRDVFGPNLDSFSSDAKPSHSKFEETISMLCNKGSNNGHSLIGGKFDPVLDGFVEGQKNEFERHERQPDLIATCKRVVLEQTGLDVGRCRSWTLLSTFIYNNKTDYFSSKSSIEYSFIYMPQIWTILKDGIEQNILDREKLSSNETPINTREVAEEAEKSEEQESSIQTELDANLIKESDNLNNPTSATTSSETEAPSINLENVADLKVADLKSELDGRGIKYKNGAKKAELVLLLQQSLQPDQPLEAKLSEESQEDNRDEENPENLERRPDNQIELEEGEVVAESNSPSERDTQTLAESTNKRKTTDDVTDEESSSKKICPDNPELTSTVAATAKEQKVELFTESLLVIARGEQQLSLVNLHEATQASRYDQFELSVASNILKESLTQHLSEYILTTLIEDNRQKMSQVGGSSASTGHSSNSSSQETSSDTNNNNSAKSTFKNPTTAAEHKGILKEFPVDRYINLAFSYFDSTHMGYVYFEDLNKLFNNTGLTISKRALVSLLGDSEKFNYRTLPDLSNKVKPTYVYEFPEHFRRLPGSSSSASSSENSDLALNGKTVEYKGVSYDVEQLISQVKDAETMRVSLVDRFNYAIENSDKQAEEIHVLEVSQKSLAKAIKAQNDELCELKKERDSIKKKVSHSKLENCKFVLFPIKPLTVLFRCYFFLFLSMTMCARELKERSHPYRISLRKTSNQQLIRCITTTVLVEIVSTTCENKSQ